MARKVLRKIRPQSKRKPRQKATKVAPKASAQVSQSCVLEKRDIAAKLIPLNLNAVDLSSNTESHLGKLLIWNIFFLFQSILHEIITLVTHWKEASR